MYVCMHMTVNILPQYTYTGVFQTNFSVFGYKSLNYFGGFFSSQFSSFLAEKIVNDSFYDLLHPPSLTFMFRNVPIENI